MIEIWKDVVGYEGYYMISNIGRVKTVSRLKRSKRNGVSPVKEYIRPPRVDKYGYHVITLCVDSKSKTFKIHRLVGIAFIPNPDNKPQINHKDGNKSNNHIDNLEWVTGLENQQHAQKMGLFNDLYTRKSKNVLQVDLNNNIISVWRSASECGRHGFKREQVRDCCLGKQETHKGFKWKYV